MSRKSRQRRSDPRFQTGFFPPPRASETFAFQKLICSRMDHNVRELFPDPEGLRFDETIEAGAIREQDSDCNLVTAWHYRRLTCCLPPNWRLETFGNLENK